MPKLQHVEENARLAKAFAPLPKDEMQRISGSLSQKYKAELDRYYRDHIDA